LRLVVRTIALLLLALALAILGRDIMAAAPETGFQMVPLGKLWFELHSGSLNLLQAVVERHIWAPLWQSAIFPILQQPAAVVVAALGIVILLLSLIGRGKRRTRPKFKD
jgi:hypothetical protein